MKGNKFTRTALVECENLDYIDVPQNSQSSFKPQVVKKRQKDISAIDDKIILIDAVHFSVRDKGIIRKLSAYIVLGINDAGYKEVLTIEVGENESSKYWLGVLNNLKKQGLNSRNCYSVLSNYHRISNLQKIFPLYISIEDVVSTN